MRAVVIVLFAGTAVAGPHPRTERERAIDSAKTIGHLVAAALAEPPPPPPPRVHNHPRELWCGLSDVGRDR